MKPFDPTSHKRVRRSAEAHAAIEAAQRDITQGNMMRIESPTALSLVGRPANERPIQVMRSSAPDTKRVSRVRRSEAPVLALTFPVGSTKEDVDSMLAEFEMTNYVVTDIDGIFVALRSDLQSLANIERTDIKLNATGVVASLDASQYNVTRAASTDNIALVAIEFDAKRFDADAVSSWVAQNGVDSVQETVENSSGDSLTVKRSEYEEGAELRRVQLEDGVVGVIKRSDVLDVPDGFASAVCETAYGNWGWGHLDFNASMADVAFCELMDDASYRLGRVLRDITIHSQLPLESRKALVDRSLAQYGDFVKNVIDALPRQVMLLVTRAAENKESNTMKHAEQGATSSATTAAAATTTAATEAPVTRAELAELINAGVAAALAQRAAPAASAETTTETTTDTATAPAAAATAAEPSQTITRSDLAEAIAAAQKPLLDRLAEVQNTVVVRSDSADTLVAAHGVKTEPVKRSAADVFKGAIPGFSVAKK